MFEFVRRAMENMLHLTTDGTARNTQLFILCVFACSIWSQAIFVSECSLEPRPPDTKENELVRLCPWSPSGVPAPLKARASPRHVTLSGVHSRLYQRRSWARNHQF